MSFSSRPSTTGAAAALTGRRAKLRPSARIVTCSTAPCRCAQTASAASARSTGSASTSTEAPSPPAATFSPARSAAASASSRVFRSRGTGS